MDMKSKDVAIIIPFPAQCIHINATGIVYKGPCYVSAITIAGDGAAADCDIYDGLNTNGERKFHLEALAGTTFIANLLHPTPFDNGIYVVVNAATTHVTIQYIPTEQGIPL